MPVSDRAIAYAESLLPIKLAIVGYAEMVFEKAKVEPRFLWDEKEDKWAGLLRSPKDLGPNGEKRVNCVCVYYDGLDLADGEFNAIMKSIQPLIPIGITYYREFILGTNQLNAEDEMQKDIAKFQFTLAEHKNLGLSGIQNHSGIRVPKLVFDGLGGTPIFFGASKLRVYMNPRQTVGALS